MGGTAAVVAVAEQQSSITLLLRFLLRLLLRGLISLFLPVAFWTDVNTRPHLHWVHHTRPPLYVCFYFPLSVKPSLALYLLSCPSLLCFPPLLFIDSKTISRSCGPKTPVAVTSRAHK